LRQRKHTKMKNLLIIIALFLSVNLLAQTSTSNQVSEPNYLLREFMKVEPGQEEAYLKIEKLWKKVHQRRIAEGKIMAWTLSERVYYGSNAPYDYVTTTVYKSGKEMDEANALTWEYIIKGLTPDEVMLINTTNKTRKMVSSQLSYQTERVQPDANANNYWKISQVKSLPGKGAELEKYEKLMKPVFEEACKMGAISGWRFGEYVFPRAKDGANYYRAIVTKNMDDMLKAENGDYIAKAFKKVYPDKDWATMNKTIADLITIQDVELLHRIDSVTN
jgi:hypothetical protein